MAGSLPRKRGPDPRMPGRDTRGRRSRRGSGRGVPRQARAIFDTAEARRRRHGRGLRRDRYRPRSARGAEAAQACSRSGVPIPDFGRFHREIRAAAQLNHPGIVPVFASGVDEHGRPYYAMREVAGRTLREAIIAFHASDRAGRRDPGERTLNFRALLNSFGSVCNTLAYAHSRGVLHRDLKPANIILGQFGETVVLDWGLVKRTEGLDESAVPFDGHPDTGDGGGAERTPFGLPHGTPEFMSPEQASGRIDDLGPATDIYSLGATLYTILTGGPPSFQGSSLEVTLQRVRSGDFPAPGKVKKAVARPLEAICLKAMSLNPADRYRSATDLARDVDHWLADERVMHIENRPGPRHGDGSGSTARSPPRSLPRSYSVRSRSASSSGESVSTRRNWPRPIARQTGGSIRRSIPSRITTRACPPTSCWDRPSSGSSASDS